ncbi:hypothetical protein K2X05_07600 [bacterium]|nr:hypothetical protein [bacterium]
MKFSFLFILALIFSGCSTANFAQTRGYQKFLVKIVADPGLRNLASEKSLSKEVLVKRCSSTADNCESGEKRLDYTAFSKAFQKKILVQSLISQQASLLEQQWASLRLDRDALKQELEEFDKSIKVNRMSSLRDVTSNIIRMRASVVIDLQEVEKQISLTEKDLSFLKSSNKNIADNFETLLQLLESNDNFGQSLVYRDNLIAQALDSVVSDMM